MSLYARLASTAQRLIRQFGQTWTITRTTGPGVSIARQVQGVVVGKVPRSAGDGGVDIGDTEMLLEASAFPEKSERITAGDASYVLLEVEPIKPAVIVLAWRVLGRDG